MTSESKYLLEGFSTGEVFFSEQEHTWERQIWMFTGSAFSGLGDLKRAYKEL